MNSEIKNIVSNGYVPISVNIKYDKVNKRYDKKPCINDWNKLNLQTFRQHIKSNNNNYGILTGSKHNLLVIDIDVKDKGLETWNEWKEQYELDETVIVKTPTGGYHYYFTCDDDTAKIYKTSRKSFEYNGERVGIDIRCNDGFVVVPPSSQGDKKYEWINNIDDTLLSDVPLWLKQFLVNSNEIKIDYNIIMSNENNVNLKILNFSELELAQHYLDNNKDNYRASYDDECNLIKLYEWCNKLKIFKCINKHTLGLTISNFYKKIKDNYDIDVICDDKEKMKEFQRVIKFIKSIGGRNKMLNLASLTIDLLITQTKNYNEDDERNTHLLNFRNGCYDMKHNIFRERNKNDFVSVYMDYDYKKTEPRYINKIKEIINNISNDDKQTLEFILSYLGYCLTGETKEKKFLILYGPSASNGKTTLQEIFSKCLKCYSFKIDRETFNYKFDKFHKQLIQSCRPKRMVFLEEMNKNKLDISKLKEFVDGNDTNCNIMYGTSQLIKIDAKLIIATNNNPVFDTDNGITRRGIIVECKNKFLDKEQYDKIKNKNNVYLKNKKIMDLFNDDKYKCAFINLLIPYAVKYYNSDELYIPKKINDEFKNLCEDNDIMKSFIKNNFEITHDDADRLTKEEFVILYNECNRTKLSFRHLLSDIKRLGITYNRQKRCKGLKGCLIGIKYLNVINDDDDFDT